MLFVDRLTRSIPRGGTMSIRKPIAIALGVLSVSVAVAPSGVGGASGARTAAAVPSELPKGSEPVRLSPDDFTTKIDNPYWPMKPGARWVYRETDPGGSVQRVVVTVTYKTKRIANGIVARIVRDTVTEDGQLVEDTWDWYAQDKAGNVWYLGELTKEYENGKFKSSAGSFEAGVDGAQPGIAMPANPKAGLAYRQEYYKGEAEDNAEIFSLDERAEVPFGYFRDIVMTKDLNPLHPKILEYKFYARGVGPVLAVGVSGGSDREELVRFTRG
jgi:hypothetical protein